MQVMRSDARQQGVRELQHRAAYAARDQCALARLQIDNDAHF
jgi:hypothetical protein